MAINIDGNGLITLGGTASTQGRVRLSEDTDNGTNYIELTAPASVASDKTITFPDATGTVVISGTTPSLNGITFPATQVASADVNTLDDYEEGTWTPNVQGASTAGTTTYSGRGGRYVKIGKLVWLRFFATYSAATGTGNFNITGLPFAVADAGLGTIMTDGLNWTGGTMQTLFINSGDTAIRLFGSADDTGWSVCQLSNENVDMQGTIIYESS
jgi:hypothetical protein